MQAHITSSVVMDIAAFKVGHSVDKDATALRAARARSNCIGTMEDSIPEGSKSEHTENASFWYTFELISVAVPWMESPPPCKQKNKQVATYFSGAMDESSG